MVKNYYCATCRSNNDQCDPYGYVAKEKLGLRLYVHVTDLCNGKCPFCRRSDEPKSLSLVDPAIFEAHLSRLSPFVSSVAFTGGEPMLYPALIDDLIGIADRVLIPDTEIDLVTNGTNLSVLPSFKNADRLTSVHVSRHCIDDDENRILMRVDTPDADEIADTVRKVNDPGKIVLNCVLQTGGVSSEADITNYLDFAIQCGVRNTSFIGMFQANQFCREHHISPWAFSITTEGGCRKWNNEHTDQQLFIWNQHTDHDWCRCLTGSYNNSSGHTRFYFRCPGDTSTRPHYCRQLVYTPDNEVRDGFGVDSTLVLSL